VNLSPCIEWLFAEGSRPFHDRVHAAAAAGFEQVEFWTTNDKDPERLEAAILDTGVTVTAFVSEPTGRLVDPATHDDFITGIEHSCLLAQRLNARGLIVVAGDTRPDVDRVTQRQALTDALRRAAPMAAANGITLLLEPLNTRIDHPGYFLDSTTEALQVLRDVDHEAVRLLYDMYHSIVMGEQPASVLAGSGGLIGHVHIADVPGRHEPGSGTVDWPRQLAALRSAGYSGALGLEYQPIAGTEAGLKTLPILFQTWPLS
jgi:hydroxypyruvate isomerase